MRIPDALLLHIASHGHLEPGAVHRIDDHKSSSRTGELDRNREMIVHCKMGGRSAKAVSLLQERGFNRVSNLKGGILAWIDKVDPSQTKY